MSLYLDLKYINLLTNRVRNFKRKSTYQFAFSCPICGDSSKDKRKARGNFFLVESRMKYHCHNCDISYSSVSDFLYNYDKSLYNDYMKDVFFDKGGTDTPTFKKEISVYEESKKHLDDLFNCTELDTTHDAVKLLTSRKIPIDFYKELYYAPKFYELVNKIIPNKIDEKALAWDKPRLIIPLFNKDGGMHGFQGRSFEKNDPNKYITIITDERYPKIYGLDRVSFNKQINVLEGPFDSMFLDNAIAVCGGNLTTTLDRFDKDKIRLIFDNEPRNEHTVKKMIKAIDDGYKVVIWPKSLTLKDINDMIISGMSLKDINHILDKNTFKGMIAKMKLIDWKKV